MVADGPACDERPADDSPRHAKARHYDGISSGVEGRRVDAAGNCRLRSPLFGGGLRHRTLARQRVSLLPPSVPLRDDGSLLDGFYLPPSGADVLPSRAQAITNSRHTEGAHDLKGGFPGD